MWLLHYLFNLPQTVFPAKVTKITQSQTMEVFQAV